MSSVASSPVGYAGPRRSPRQRPTTSRRRTFSISGTTTSNGSIPRVTLAEWQVPSLSDLHSSKAGSQVDVDVIMRHHFPNHRENSGSTSAEGARLRRASTTGSRRAAVVPKRDPPVYPRRMSALPPLPAPSREEKLDMSRRPGIRGFLSNATSRLDPKEVSSRRPSGASAEANHTLAPTVRPVLDETRPLSFTYDSQSRRLTGLEDWQAYFPNEPRDPFAGLGVSEAEMERMMSLSSAYDIYKLLSRRIAQKMESLASTAKTRIPQVFRLMISTIPKGAQDDEPHNISAPFNVVHTMTVRSDPATGRPLGMPEQWNGGQTGTPVAGGRPHAVGARPADVAKKDPSKGSFWGALRREIRAPKEALRNIQLSRSSSTSHTPTRRNSRPHQASFSEYPTKTHIAGDHDRRQIPPSNSEIRFLHQGEPSLRRTVSAATRKPRRKAVPQLTEEEWQEIHADQVPQVRVMPHPRPTPTTFAQFHPPQPFPYGTPANAFNGFPGQWIPMYPPVPVFFGSYDDLTLSR